MSLQTFKYSSGPLKIARNCEIKNDAIYKVKVSNLRLDENDNICADVAYKSINNKRYNSISLPEETSSTDSVKTNLTIPAQKGHIPLAFLSNFKEEDIPVTKLQCTFEIDKPADNACKRVKDFYIKHLSERAIEVRWKKIKEELTERNNRIQTDSEEKIRLVKAIRMKLDLPDKSNEWVWNVFAGFSLLLVETLFMYLLGLVGAALHVPLVVITMIQAFCYLQLLVGFVNDMIRRKLDTLRYFGEVENESIDTPKGKAHLIKKLIDVFDVKPEQAADYKLATEKAIDIGQKSYGSYFERFKSFFNKDAYHYGYFLGKELAAKKTLALPKLYNFKYFSTPIQIEQQDPMKNKAIYEVKISNYRLDEKGNIWADVTYKSKNIKNYHMNSLLEKTSSTDSVETNLTMQALKGNIPHLFISEFKEKDIPVTSLDFTFEIDEPSYNSSKLVKDFYKKNLCEKTIEDHWKKIKEELIKRHNHIKTHRKEKTKLVKLILKQSSWNSFWGWTALSTAGFLLLFASSVVIILLGLIGTALSLPLIAISTIKTGVLLSCFALAVSVPFLLKKFELDRTGELDNESIDTPKAKSHLIRKLVNLFDVKPEQAADYKLATEKAIDIGQKSYGSYFKQFKSFFNKDAYHYAYYIGKDMAHTKAKVAPN